MNNFSISRYFTGLQTKIYINGLIPVAEANSISGVFTINHQPVYGYASNLYDAIAPGHVFVQGQLIINYVMNGYLFALMHKLQQFTTQPIFTTDSLGNTNSLGATSVATPLNDDTQNAHSFVITERDNFITEYDALIGDVVQELRKIYWGGQDSRYETLSSYNDYKVIRSEYLTPVNLHVRDFRLGLVVDETTLDEMNSQSDQQDTATTDSESLITNETFSMEYVKKEKYYEEFIIYNALFNSCSTVRSPDGTPVSEVYTFIAQNII